MIEGDGEGRDVNVRLISLLKVDKRKIVDSPDVCDKDHDMDDAL